MTNYLFGITDPGLERDNNEDVFIAAELSDRNYLIAGVIDGVGGYAGGEIAAALTKDCLLRELSGDITDAKVALLQSLYLANEKIIFEKKTDPDLADMACVASIALLDSDQNLLHYAHVGDTRLYLYRDQTLIKISQDQSFVGFLEDSGRLSEAEAMQHPKRNQINQALGLLAVADMTENYIETGSSPFLPGDLVLVCSDGLTDMISQQEISAVLEEDLSLEQKGTKLVYLANAAGGKDNVTVVLAKNNKPPVHIEKIMPVDSVLEEDIPFVFETENQFRTESVEIETSVEAEDPIVTLPLQSARHQYFQSEEEVVVEEDKRQSHHWLIILGCFLITLLLGTAGWWFFRSPAEGLKETKEKKLLALLPAEKQLRDTLLGFKGDTLVLKATDFNGLVQLTRPLEINRDSLIIQSEGSLTLLRDSLFQGVAAIVLNDDLQSIQLAGFKISGFEVGIRAVSNALTLKDITFENCHTAIENRFLFKNNERVSGSVSRKSFRVDTAGKP